VIRARAVLWLLALGFAGFGIAYACWPTAMASLTDISLPSATARVDFVATYGGFQLGFAAFLSMCAIRPGWVRVGLLASGCALLGFAVLRLLGVVLQGGAVGAAIYIGLGLELIGAALAFVGSAWAAEQRNSP
jgi:hypothetical protein